MRFRISALVALGLSQFASLPIGSAKAEDFVCHWAVSPIVIDGRPDDEAWSKASMIDRFRIPMSTESPKTSTRARLLWDRQYLYFLAELEDRDLFADVTERDGKTWDNDVFELFFKPSRDNSGYYEFQVNAAGTEMDMFLPNKQSGGYQALKSLHNFHWQTAVHRSGSLNQRDDTDQSWTVEGRIPWLDFMHTGGRPNVDEVWQLALCRYDYTGQAKPELSSCAPLTQVNFHRVEDYASLRFASPSATNPAAARFRARPHSLKSNVVGSPEPPLPFRPVRALPGLKLEWPVDVQTEPGSERLIVIEEKGAYGHSTVKRTTDDPSNGQLETIIDPKGVAYSIAFHPQFRENGYMYLGSNGKREGEKNKSRVVRYKLSRTAPFEIVGDPLTIIEWDSNGHNGAAVTFGLDGYMYVTSGDGTSDSDTNVTGQDLSLLLAKVLRIDVDHPDEGKAYSVPKDNPFVGMADVRPETWAYGLRNPWRITTDAKTGHVWVGNNGQDMWEQAYLVQRGANYGWSVYEGSNPFYLQRKLGPTPHVKPTVEHSHSESRSLTGGVVYHGEKLADLRGAYIYGDYSTGKIWAVKHDGVKILSHREICDTTFQISAISLDPRGELIVVDHRGDGLGGLYHLEPVPVTADEPSKSFPRRLSETGLFEQVAGHRVAAGLIPYSVNAPFWSDGATKSRFIALPPEGIIDPADSWAWKFPENTVLVKSFQLEMKAGDPTSQRWIETRLLTKQQGEWVGYTYQWNEQQTDATLVESAGRDHTFLIQEADGQRRQLWRYPSRTECMVCHTRAAGFVLGLTTLQMNKVHDYGSGDKLNQLEALEIAGLLKTSWIPQAKEALRDQLQAQQMPSRTIDEHLKALKVSDGQRGTSSDRLLGKPADEHGKLVDPYDPTATLELRARSFLHSNCAYCHIDAGGGNSQINLTFSRKSDGLKAIDVAPVHHTFGKKDAKLIAPGDSERSVLLHRVAMRGQGQMPQLGSSLVDEAAVKMLRDWVTGLKSGEN